MKQIKIIHVYFLSSRKNHYFGSVRAVFSVFSEEELGCSYNYLRHILSYDGSCHLSSKAYFHRSTLIQYRSK